VMAHLKSQDEWIIVIYVVVVSLLYSSWSLVDKST
jgi:hypothetical protein